MHKLMSDPDELHQRLEEEFYNEAYYAKIEQDKVKLDRKMEVYFKQAVQNRQDDFNHLDFQGEDHRAVHGALTNK